MWIDVCCMPCGGSILVNHTGGGIQIILDAFVQYKQPTVRLTSIDHPQIEGAYISGLRAANFIVLVCVQSSSE